VAVDEQSILDSVKKVVGLPADDDSFDADIIMFINGNFATLNQLGVGEDTFYIEDNTAKWGEFAPNVPYIGMIKSYMTMKVRLQWDPPQVSSLLASMEKMVAEYEWRLNVFADKGLTVIPVVVDPED